MLFHFAATLEHNDRKVHIIKLLKAEKDPSSSTAAHHIQSEYQRKLWPPSESGV